MQRSNWKLIAGLVVVAVSTSIGIAQAAAPGSSAKAKARPNIVVIETDDQTLDSMRVMSSTLRLLGKEGTTFDQNFVSFSLCCPSRSTFLTGQYAHNHGVLGNSPPAGGYHKLDHSNTLPVWLQRAGYYTAEVGKYLNGYGKPNPLEIPPGWNEWHAGVNLAFTGGTMNENGKLVQLPKNESGYQTDVWARIARDVIHRRAPSQPFFLWLTPHVPHSGGPADADDPKGVATTRPAARHRDKFSSEQLPMSPSFNEADVSDKPAAMRNRPLLTPERIAGMREAYQQQLEALLAVDEAVAGIIDELRSSGELSNTVVIYTDDNGFFYGEHRVPAGKVLLYEPSIHVPLLIRGPGIPKGRHLKQIVANIDLAPTILDLANAKAGRTMDGRSLLPLFKNPKLEWGRDLVIERGPATGGKKGNGGKGAKAGKAAQGDSVFGALRTPGYLYAEYASGEKELYDLAKDPNELTSRHNDPAYAAMMGQFAARLTQMRGCAGAVCRQGPRVSLEVRRAVGRSTVRAVVAGSDARWVQGVGFSVADRAAGTDRAAPFSRLLETRGSRSVTALVTMKDGRRMTLTRTIGAR